MALAEGLLRCLVGFILHMVHWYTCDLGRLESKRCARCCLPSGVWFSGQVQVVLYTRSLNSLVSLSVCSFNFLSLAISEALLAAPLSVHLLALKTANEISETTSVPRIVLRAITAKRRDMQLHVELEEEAGVTWSASVGSVVAIPTGSVVQTGFGSIKVVAMLMVETDSMVLKPGGVKLDCRVFVEGSKALTILFCVTQQIYMHSGETINLGGLYERHIICLQATEFAATRSTVLGSKTDLTLSEATRSCLW